MRVAIINIAEIAACHDILSPEFWINQRLKAEWDGRSAADRAMAVAHYKQQMATARSLRDQAEALVDHARMIEADVTEDGYDFNGWILEFFQEHCNGIVQIDQQGFFSPKGELIVDLSLPEE